jgi:hypothetical protein
MTNLSLIDGLNLPYKHDHRMKIALCFSGFPRFYKQTFPFWKACLIDPYKPDVFVHTWDTSEVVKHTLHGMYQPKVLKAESAQEWDTSTYNDDHAPGRRLWLYRTTHVTQISQYQGIKRSLNLRQSYERSLGFTYDIVIRARFDWYLEKVILEKNNFINVAHTPTLCGHTFSFKGKEYLGISDQFAYGSSANMTTYSELVDNLPNLYHTYKVDFCGELFLKSHLLYHNIDVKEHHWNNGIVRDWGVMP